MVVGTASRGNLFVHRKAQQRMHERQRLLREDPGRQQLISCGHGAGLPEPRELGGLAQIGVLENGHRLRNGRDFGPHSLEPAENNAPDRLRAGLLHLGCVRGGRRHLLAGEVRQQLTEQERVAARGSRAGTAELRVRLLVEPLADQLSDTAAAQDGWRQNGVGGAA